MTDMQAKLNAIRAKVDKGDYGRLYGLKETADDQLKIVDAILRADAPKGSVAEMDAWVKSQSEHANAVLDKENAYADWMTAQTYMKLAFAEFDLWRSEEATNRGLDRRS